MRRNPTRRFRLSFLALSLILFCMPALSEGACGASASSCKNCHEIKGEHRVNGKGNYHIQHAFGDFCAFCHSGNTAGTNKAESHAGMVKPEDNLKQSCASCHPDDFEERAKRYGFTVKTGGAPGGGAGNLGAGHGAGTAPGSGAGNASGVKKSAPAGGAGWILPPTPDPSAVSPKDLIDYNLYWVRKKKGSLPGTRGDRILIFVTLLLLPGFPLLSRIFGTQHRRNQSKTTPPEQKRKRKETLDGEIA